VKAPRPNSDQTKVSKEKMLKLSAMLGRTCAYYALPYNPYGTRAAYGHSPPGRWFDMRNDEVVLMGDEFWSRLGGEGTLAEILELLGTVGPRLQQRIRREYLGLL
jgi:Type II restriction endonuclease, TdeIII